MANKPKKSKKNKKQKEEPTWQEIAEARKPVAQKAIELLDDPTKRLILPKEVVIEKEIKFKAQPDPTHIVVTELSPPRRITSPIISPPKKVLKSEIAHKETRTLTPEEIDNLQKEMQQASVDVNGEAEDDLIKSLKDAAQKLMQVFHKKKSDPNK